MIASKSLYTQDYNKCSKWVLTSVKSVLWSSNSFWNAVHNPEIFLSLYNLIYCASFATCSFCKFVFSVTVFHKKCMQWRPLYMRKKLRRMIKEDGVIYHRHDEIGKCLLHNMNFYFPSDLVKIYKSYIHLTFFFLFIQCIIACDSENHISKHLSSF